MLQEGQAGKEKPGWDKPGRDGELRSTIIIPNYNGIKYIENCLVSSSTVKRQDMRAWTLPRRSMSRMMLLSRNVP